SKQDMKKRDMTTRTAMARILWIEPKALPMACYASLEYMGRLRRFITTAGSPAQCLAPTQRIDIPIGSPICSTCRRSHGESTWKAEEGRNQRRAYERATNMHGHLMLQRDQFRKRLFPTEMLHLDLGEENGSLCKDHCRMYALSDPKDKELQQTCPHEHSMKCEECENLKFVIKDIEEKVENLCQHSSMTERREDMLYDLKQAAKDIFDWKSHILRSTNQENGKQDALRQLDEKTVLVVMDWAMKFQPRKYREKQSEWFGKRGLSWHVSSVISKTHQLQATFITVRSDANFVLRRTHYRVFKHDLQRGILNRIKYVQITTSPNMTFSIKTDRRKSSLEKIIYK
ncbi:Hypothetical predicted protein, partial [Paramuricea clavata]